jgi:hypothetical protein
VRLVRAAARESAEVLRARRDEDGLWRQDDDYRGLGTLHGAAGNTLVLLRLEPDDALVAETAGILAQLRSMHFAVHALGPGRISWPARPSGVATRCCRGT